jgi:hypothetical protein
MKSGMLSGLEKPNVSNFFGCSISSTLCGAKKLTAAQHPLGARLNGGAGALQAVCISVLQLFA